jgi:hypothetical protein
MSRLPRVVSTAAEATEVPANEPVTFEFRDKPSGGTEGRHSDETRQIAEQAARQVALAQRETLAAHLNSVETGLQAAGVEYATARQNYDAAVATGDHAAAADAVAQMNAIQNRAMTMAQGRDELTAELRRPPQPTARDVHSYIDSMQGLQDAERRWLHDHPDSLMGENLQRLDLAYKDASMRGIARGTPAYFEFFEDRLGYRSTPVPRSGSAATPSAFEPDWKPRGQITLSPAQIQAARDTGLTIEEYAKEAMRLAELKKAGHYQDH